MTRKTYIFILFPAEIYVVNISKLVLIKHRL